MSLSLFSYVTSQEEKGNSSSYPFFREIWSSTSTDKKNNFPKCAKAKRVCKTVGLLEVRLYFVHVLVLHIKTNFLLGCWPEYLSFKLRMNIANNLHDRYVNQAAMFLMLPNLKIGFKTTCKWRKIQEVTFRTNGREKWNPESDDDSWLLSLKCYFEFIQTLELEKCTENMLITFPLLIQQIIVMSLV